MSDPDPLHEILDEPEPLRAPRVFARDYVPPEPPRRRRRWGLWLFLALLLLLLTPPAVVVALRWVPPPTTAFMLRSPTQPVDYVWVPAAQHPQALRDAVVAAEDQKFWSHLGFDLAAIEAALEHNQKNRRKRGASTITQQVAKNLFMWESQTYLRKGIEATFTILLELCWTKERILETYLNIAEFGPGTYGVEAAARKFFGKSAQELSPTESARLAAVLPSPRKWSAKRPGRYVQARTDWILAQIGYGPRPLPEPAELMVEPTTEPATAPMTEPTPEDPASGTATTPGTEPEPGEPPLAEPLPGAPQELPEPVESDFDEPAQDPEAAPEGTAPAETAPPPTEPPPTP